LEEINDYQKLFKAARAKIGFDPEVTEAYEMPSKALIRLSMKFTILRLFSIEYIVLRIRFSARKSRTQKEPLGGTRTYLWLHVVF
jgi:hypothetical protein